MRSESASRSMAVIFPSVMVNPKTTRARPPSAQTAPGEPSTRASFAARAVRRRSPRPPLPRVPPSSTDLHCGRVGPEHHVGVQQSEQYVEVTSAGGGHASLDDLPLAGPVGRGCRTRPAWAPGVSEACPGAPALRLWSASRRDWTPRWCRIGSAAARTPARHRRRRSGNPACGRPRPAGAPGCPRTVPPASPVRPRRTRFCVVSSSVSFRRRRQAFRPRSGCAVMPPRRTVTALCDKQTRIGPFDDRRLARWQG